VLSELHTLEFQAARRLAAAPADQRESRSHGHGFRLLVQASHSAGKDLRARLSRLREDLDYSALDHRLDDPTDARLLSQLMTALPDAGPAALEGAPGRGVRRDAQGIMHAWCRMRFESAHRLPHVPPGHKCGRLHGHGFAAVIHVRMAAIDARWNADQQRITAAWQPLHSRLHQRYLNDLPGLANPTSEVLASWIWNALIDALPELSWVTVHETAGCGAHFDGTSHRIWKDFGIDSATVEEGRILGHSWTLRLHLHGAPDPLYGWTMDFAEVKTAFQPVLLGLDHQPLHALDGLRSPDSRGLAEFVRSSCPPELARLGRVDVMDGCGGGVTHDWAAGGLQPMP
jgi:6-pyruvoyltetrahydropterin/6-carboxytetrahydropterin synthase